KAERLRHGFGPLGEARWRKAVLARESVDRGLEHVVAGGAAHAPVEPQFRLPCHRVPARFGVALVELSLQERLKVRHLEIFDHLPVLRDGTADAGQFADRSKYFFDRVLQVGCDQWPGLSEQGSSAVVDPVEGKTRIKSGNWFGRGHGSRRYCSGCMVADNGCPTINDLVTLSLAAGARKRSADHGAPHARLQDRLLIKKAGGRSLPLSRCADGLRPTRRGASANATLCSTSGLSQHRQRHVREAV